MALSFCCHKKCLDISGAGPKHLDMCLLVSFILGFQFSTYSDICSTVFVFLAVGHDELKPCEKLSAVKWRV